MSDIKILRLHQPLLFAGLNNKLVSESAVAVVNEKGLPSLDEISLIKDGLELEERLFFVDKGETFSGYAFTKQSVEEGSLFMDKVSSVNLSVSGLPKGKYLFWQIPDRTKVELNAIAILTELDAFALWKGVVRTGPLYIRDIDEDGNMGRQFIISVEESQQLF